MFFKLHVVFSLVQGTIHPAVCCLSSNYRLGVAYNYVTCLLSAGYFVRFGVEILCLEQYKPQSES
jgi:hypothetical protein